jgi:hypothetical protein
MRAPPVGGDLAPTPFWEGSAGLPGRWPGSEVGSSYPGGGGFTLTRRPQVYLTGGTFSSGHRPLVHFQVSTGGTFWVAAEERLAVEMNRDGLMVSFANVSLLMFFGHLEAT